MLRPRAQVIINSLPKNDLSTIATRTSIISVTTSVPVIAATRSCTIIVTSTTDHSIAVKPSTSASIFGTINVHLIVEAVIAILHFVTSVQSAAVSVTIAGLIMVAVKSSLRTIVWSRCAIAWSGGSFSRCFSGDRCSNLVVQR